jgi:hypothetical protein
MQRMTRRPTRPAGILAAAGVLLGLAFPPLARAEQRKLLVSQVTWVDSTNATGTMLFQGEVVDGALTGRVYPGDGTELVVAGTVGSDGRVAGALQTTDSQVVADFTGQLDAAQELAGALVVDGDVSATWAAPASELPVP